MFLNEISYGTLLGGHFTGVVGFQLELTGEEDSGSEVGEILYAIRRHEKGPSKLVVLRGEFTSANAIDLQTLVKSLKDTGYFVGAVTTTPKFFQWFKDVGYLIAETDHPEWIGFEVNEIWYLFYEDSQPEIILPQTAKIPTLYLVPGGKTSPKGMMAFLKHAKYPWAVYLEPKQQILEVVSYGEKP